MSEKRRDNRNRILREGEYQRTDGRYRYRYIDEDGKEKNVYSWRLDKNDPTPRGKKRELSLREKEKQIQADLFDHIVTRGGNYTVVELVEKYTSLKTGVGHNTKAGYKTVINILNREAFGKQRIDKVRLSDAKAWLIKLQQVDGRGYSSIHSIRGVLRPAFQLAVDDDLIRKNPFGFELASVIVNDSVTREAITRILEHSLAVQTNPRILRAGNRNFDLRIFPHILVDVLGVVGAEPQLAVQLAREHEGTALCLAVTTDGSKILHRVGIQKFYDFIHDKYLRNLFFLLML